MKSLVFWLLGLLVLVAPVSAQTYGIASQQGATVYDFEGLIEEAALGRWQSSRRVGSVTAAQTPMLSQAPFNTFHRTRLHRALALGHPETCPFSVRATGYASPQLAVANGLEQCLIRVAQFQGYSQATCGCRVAIVDDLILGDPDAVLAIPEFVPGYIETDGRRTLGLFRHSGWQGRDLDISFQDRRGRTRCTGTYNIGALIVNNSFTLSCDLFDGVAQGRMGVRDLETFNPWGNFSGQTADGAPLTITMARPLGHP